MRGSHALTTQHAPSNDWSHKPWKPFQIVFVCWVLSTGSRMIHLKRRLVAEQGETLSRWTHRSLCSLINASNGTRSLTWMTKKKNVPSSVKSKYLLHFYSALSSASVGQRSARSAICGASRWAHFVSHHIRQYKDGEKNKITSVETSGAKQKICWPIHRPDFDSCFESHHRSSKWTLLKFRVFICYIFFLYEKTNMYGLMKIK